MDSHPPADTGQDGLEFEGPAPTAARSARVRPWRAALIAAPVIAALLALALTQPGFQALFSHAPPQPPTATFTIICDVPWAVVALDHQSRGLPFRQEGVGELPTVEVALTPGAHQLRISARGFATLLTRVTVYAQRANLIDVQLALTPSGAAQALAAINTYLATHAYAQRTLLPTSLWQTLGLPGVAPHDSRPLTLDERFVATALDPHATVYDDTNVFRPVPPEAGAVGVAALLVEQYALSRSSGQSPVSQGVAPVGARDTASVTFSLHITRGALIADAPYLLNPLRTAYSTLDQAASPATPFGLLAFTARAHLADALGTAAVLAAALSPVAVASSACWVDGLGLAENTAPSASLFAPVAGHDATQSARWLYLAGQSLALNSQGEALTPGERRADAQSLAALGAWQAGLQTTSVCDQTI